MRSRRVGLAVGVLAALIAIGCGVYLIGVRQGAEMAEPDPYRYAFLLIPVIAIAGGWMVDWNAGLAVSLLGAASVLSLLAFGLSLPGLILVVLLGGAALLIWLQELM